MSKELQNLLNELDLLSNEAVFFFDEKEKWSTIVSSETKKKLEKISPSAFYIFNNVPFILFFDLSSDTNLKREYTIHKQVWSFDQSPLAFVIKNTEVKIYNAFAYEKKTNSLQEIKLEKGKSRAEIFSFWKLQSGSTWKWLQSHYKEGKQNDRITRVYQKLFDNIKRVRESLKESGKLSEDDSNTLILRLIFIRYLIDSGVEMNPEFIPGKSIIEKRINFSSLIENPERLNIYCDELNLIFNGVLFKDKITLSWDQAKYLADVFSERSSSDPSLWDGTDYYFSIFDFNIIPVELISGIYESLIDPETRNADSAFYTPLFIVEQILSNTIDKFFEKEENRNRSECKVFDASAGSGIFLVQAFRRMVDREILLTGNKSISKKRLSDIAVQNLWGIDINPEALKVACFSVYIAILDYEDPGTIMDKFNFPKLNLYPADFFEIDPNHNLNREIINVSFDFILGNPPWKKDKSEKHLEWVNSRNIYSRRVTGEIEIAQDFLLRVREFMTDNTICSLIVSSPIFYNISPTSRIFKSTFLTSTNISNIIDLSPVRRYIFEGKKIEVDEETGIRRVKSISNPALIITFKKTNGNFRESLIEYTSVKSNLFTKLYKILVIEKFDRKQILQSYFVDNEWMFKVALYGNTLDYHFLIRLNNLPDSNTLNELNAIQIKRDGLKRDLLKNKGIENIDNYITEKGSIHQYYTPTLNHSTENKNLQTLFNLFGYSKVLLKGQTLNESDIIASFSEGFSIYRNDTFIISTPNDSELKVIYAYLISNLYKYYIFNISCAWGVGTRPAIRLKDEYLQFPFVDSIQKNELVNLVDNFIEPFRNYYAKKLPTGEVPENEKIKGKINKVINRTYQVNGYEEDLIDYVLDVSRYQFQESKLNRILRKVKNEEDTLPTYADVFFSELEPIYSDEYMRVEVYNLDNFIALNFLFSREKPAKKVYFETKEKNEWTVLKKIAQTVSISQISKDIFIQKDIKGFETDSFYIIKPNEYKCWHRAMAWYDVAEIKQMIETDELEYLKVNPDAI